MERFGFDPRFSAIVVTGGPCAGKSTFMAVARQYLEDHGLRVAVQPEVATEFITSGFHPVKGWRTSEFFQRYLLRYMLYREEMYYQMLLDLHTEKSLVLLCDRGVLDAMAYIGRQSFVSLLDSFDLDLHALRERYRAVVHLVTAADGAEKFYTLENNLARDETPAQARILDGKTRAAWTGHSHLSVIDNSTGFDQKVHRALTSLARVLDMPTPQEKERKFLLRGWHRGLLPADAVSVEIVQTYLTFGENGKERRVRMRTLDGSSSYYYTRKLDTAEPGVRDEEEEQISRARYEELLGEQDKTTVPIEKTRHVFTFEGHTFEIDQYKQPVHSLVIGEVEVADMSEPIAFPPGPAYDNREEITGVKKYKNRSIAEGSLGDTAL